MASNVIGGTRTGPLPAPSRDGKWARVRFAGRSRRVDYGLMRLRRWRERNRRSPRASRNSFEMRAWRRWSAWRWRRIIRSYSWLKPCMAASFLCWVLVDGKGRRARSGPEGCRAGTVEEDSSRRSENETGAGVAPRELEGPGTGGLRAAQRRRSAPRESAGHPPLTAVMSVIWFIGFLLSSRTVVSVDDRAVAMQVGFA